MVNNLSYLKNQDFSVILNSIHIQMKEKMERLKEDNKAKKIEQFLKNIKKTTRQMKEKKQGLKITGYINEELASLIEETFNQQVMKHSKLSSNTSLFQRSHRLTKSIKLADDIFEEQLAYLIQAAAKMNNKEINVEVMLQGGKAAYSTAVNKITKHTQSILIDLINTAQKRYAADINSNKAIFSTVSEISANVGKTDISVPAELKIEGKIEEGSVQQFLSLIAGATFSLKNYSSFKKDTDNKISKKNINDINIHLGNTNIYKAITGALSEVLSDPRAQKRVFWRGMTVLSGKSEQPDTASQQEVFQHFAHLKFIYELRGSGLIDKNGNSKVSDYIIWNDPNSEDIAVRSTASLINQYWESYARTLGAISISAGKLKKY